MIKNDNGKYQKVSTVFYCKDCDYTTSYKSNIDKHKLTIKSKMIMYDNEKSKNVSDKINLSLISEIFSLSLIFYH